MKPKTLTNDIRAAGSRAVLVTHWSVFDTAARDFVVEFFEHAPKVGPDAALATTLKARRDASFDDNARRTRISLAHPTFWAAYVLVKD